MLPQRPAFWPVLLALHVALAAFLVLPFLRRQIAAPIQKRWPAAWRILRLWYPLLLIPLFYKEASILTAALHGGLYFDRQVLVWQRQLFGAVPALYLAGEAPSLLLSELLHAAYLSYYVIIFLPPLIMYLKGDARAFRTTILLLTATALGHYLVFILFPVRGPRYLFPAPDAGVIETGLLYQLVHTILEGGSTAGTAFPSGHVGISTAQTIAAFLFLPRLAPVFALLTLGMAVSTVYGRFHYILDVIAAVLLTTAVAAVVLYTTRSWRSDNEAVRS